MTPEDWLRPFVPGRGYRVHPDPELLPRRPRFEQGETARNRFDDPAGQYLVRYLGSTLRGCLLEVMANFRTRQPLEDRLAGVTNADPEPGDLVDLEGKETEPGGSVPLEWLARQQVGRCWVHPDAVFADVANAWFLAEHDRSPRVRRAIDRHLGEQYDLDAATMMLNLDLGRPVTQAVSATVWDRIPRPNGIRYLSRLDITEECWAVFDHTPVGFDEFEQLEAGNDDHRDAVRSVAALLQLVLPLQWQDATTASSSLDPRQ